MHLWSFLMCSHNPRWALDIKGWWFLAHMGMSSLHLEAMDFLGCVCISVCARSRHQEIKKRFPESSQGSEVTHSTICRLGPSLHISPCTPCSFLADGQKTLSSGGRPQTCAITPKHFMLQKTQICTGAPGSPLQHRQHTHPWSTRLAHTRISRGAVKVVSLLTAVCRDRRYWSSPGGDVVFLSLRI